MSIFAYHKKGGKLGKVEYSEGKEKLSYAKIIDFVRRELSMPKQRVFLLVVDNKEKDIGKEK